MILPFLHGAAQATLVSGHYCVELETGFADEATGDLLHEEAGTFGDQPAYGIRMIVGTQEAHAGWSTNAGCVDILLDDDYDYLIKIEYSGLIDGNDLHVYSGAGNPFSTTLDTSFSHPPSGSGITWYVSESAQGNVYGAASHALQRRRGGITGETFEFRTAAAPGGGNAYVSSTELIWILDDDYKFIIAHELGHALFDAANGRNGYNLDDSATLNGCTPAPDGQETGHEMNTKEFQSNAAVEGAASFYAGMTFNFDTTETDCMYELKGAVDWNLDGEMTFTADDPSVFSCEAGIVLPNDPDIDGGDFLGDYCIASAYVNNRATQYDWTRALWDFRSGQGAGFDDILETWNRANPNTWNATGHGTGGDYPIQRWRDAVDDADIGLLTEWDNVDNYNGVQR